MTTTRVFLIFCVVCAVTAGAEASEGIEAITRPSKDPTLSFVRAGRIAEVLVKKGDLVQAGQLLVQQDDAAEQVQLEQLKAQAEDTTKIKIAQADLDEKNLNLEKMQDLFERKAATEWEVREAKLKATIAELSLAMANFEHQQDQRKYEEFRIHLERMKLSSPIVGKVEEILVQPGESVEALEDVVQVVKIDPLWIDVPVPLAKIKELKIKTGRAAEVEFAGSSKLVRTGRIIHIAAVADAASDTLTVRVEVFNPAGPTSRPAGEHVRVRFAGLAETASLQNGHIRVSGISHESKDKE